MQSHKLLLAAVLCALSFSTQAVLISGSFTGTGTAVFTEDVFGTPTSTTRTGASVFTVFGDVDPACFLCPSLEWSLTIDGLAIDTRNRLLRTTSNGGTGYSLAYGNTVGNLGEATFSGFLDTANVLATTANWFLQTASNPPGAPRPQFSNIRASFQADAGTVTTSVPEPDTIALLGLGLIALGIRRKRR